MTNKIRKNIIPISVIANNTTGAVHQASNTADDISSAIASLSELISEFNTGQEKTSSEEYGMIYHDFITLLCYEK